MFKANTIIKHEKFMDVAFCVLRAVELTDKWVISGQWLNQGFTRHWVIDYRPVNIEVPKSKVPEWSETDIPDTDISLRKVEWRKCV